MIYFDTSSLMRSSSIAVTDMPATEAVAESAPTKKNVRKSKSVSDLTYKENDMFEKALDGEEVPETETTKRPKGLKKFGKGFKNLFRRKSVKKNAKNQVQEITIIQEDDTDYEKQWSRKVSRARSFVDQSLLTTPTTEGAVSPSRASSSAGSASSSKPEDDSIPVILDAEEEDLS